jgi:plasmid stabilization system protein ParE
MAVRPIVWTDEAPKLSGAHLEAIVEYVEAFNPAAARRLGERLIEAADSLAEFAERGRDAGLGRREMTTVWPYVLRYRVEMDQVVILRIRHGARDEEVE